MRFGVCTAIDNIHIAEKLGYDFIEPSLSALAAMDEAAYEAAKLTAAAAKIKCEGFNMLFPQDIRLVGPEQDLDAIRNYVRGAFARAAALDAQIVVFGSGAARRCPDGFSMQEAYSQLIGICKLLGDEAAAVGITVVVEPLNAMESNNIISVKAGLELVKKTNHPNVALLADLFHMEQEGEGLEVLGTCGAYLRHCHISYGPKRAYLTAENLPACAPFIRMLEDIGYSGRLSVEGITENFEADADASIACLREGGAL